ncbi:hypothetical protein ACRE_009260 [Hapsidospora chrysogenum ATCC 11550]|uniref:DUF7587 domain-containing protein n=1 Tax=Hapsidospora chrysogenum (strain ATCC 11550 / CBS 779.69 / DSM 880 / IAM 14645 / JCM 23072 / IMI 49137) TaxID=857340 RepID=A0A086TFY8_HAPC1|nr:hypothetical protein ACRE_009260 [Hapsidospora chrysogenum ATCC 11550]
MASRIQWRAEDDDSQVQTTMRRGAVAADVKSRVGFGLRTRHERARLRRKFHNQLDWSNRTKTPFISTYGRERAALEEAGRRKRDGKKNVRVVKIDTYQADCRVEYRNVRKLAKALGYWIPDKAWRNSEFEYIFLRHIPASAIMEIIWV